jgi:hypothetical protein
LALAPSPGGTADKGVLQPSLRDLGMIGYGPSVETLGYCHPSLRDEGIQILVALDIPVGLGWLQVRAGTLRPRRP